MATTTLKTRIQHKYNTPAEWAENASFVPLKGEICVFNNGTGAKPEMKIGDGTTTLASLPFLKAGGDMAISRSLTSGTKIATITIDGVATDLYCQTNTDTTYSAGTGLSLSGTTFSLNVAGAKTALGLGSAAYTASTAYATAGHTHNYAGSDSAGGAAYQANKLGINTEMNYGWNGLNYYNISGTAGAAAKVNDTPTTAWWHIIKLNHANNSGYYTDLAIPFNDISIYYKRICNGVIQNNGWVKVLDALNYTEYVPTKTGAGASGTWDINVSGYSKQLNRSDNASYARLIYTNANQSSYHWGQIMYDSNNKPCYVYYSTSKDAEAPSVRMYGPDGGTSALVLTTANYTSYCAPASHTHSYLPLAGGTLTGNMWINNNSWPQIGFSNANGKGRALIYQDTGTGAVGPLYLRVYTDDTGSNYVSARLDTAGGWYASKVYGAVWNDYAEFRTTVPNAKPGQVVIENGDGSLRLSTERLQPGCEVVSDTFGFAIGETDNCKTPIAVSGRVLAYTYEDRNTFIAGEPVCSGPNGTISRMTREEVKEYPERIIGTVSEIPSYEYWGTGNAEVNGRIWIRIK